MKAPLETVWIIEETDGNGIQHIVEIADYRMAQDEFNRRKDQNPHNPILLRKVDKYLLQEQS